MKREGFYLILILVTFTVLLSLFNIFLFQSVSQNFVLGSATNQGTLTLRVVGGDNIAPAIDLTYPGNISYSSQKTELNYSVYDNNILDSCWYSLNSGTTNTSVTCGQNVTGISSSLGTNTWTVYANDTFGNENSSSATFFIESGGGGGGGDGGGGGGGGPELEPFSVNPRDTSLELTEKDSIAEEIKIVNIIDCAITLDFSLEGFDSTASLSSTSTTLLPGEVYSLFLISELLDPGVYTGKVLVSSGNIVKEVLVVLTVRSEKLLFDISLEISDEFRKISVGKNVSASISIYNLDELLEAGEINATYLIKDFSGNVLYEDSEILFVEDRTNYNYVYPTDFLSAGEYVIAVENIYQGGFAVSSVRVSIIDEDFNYLLWLAIAIAVILAAVVLWRSIYTYKKSEKYKK